jgi:hypothetical protein
VIASYSKAGSQFERKQRLTDLWKKLREEFYPDLG